MSIQSSLNSITSSALSITKTAVGAVTDTDEKAEKSPSNKRKPNVGNPTPVITNAPTSQNLTPTEQKPNEQYNKALEIAKRAIDSTEVRKMQMRMNRPYEQNQQKEVNR